jgi:peptidoglycan hydrolase CwlO-like protein
MLLYKAQAKRIKMKQNFIEKTPRLTKQKKVALVILSIFLAFASVFSSVTSGRIAYAQCNTITECNQQINNDNNKVADLQQQALSYQDAINHLNAQIAQLQGSINDNAAKQADLQNQIQANQMELDRQRAGLADDIKAMYVDGQPTSLEMLASSDNLSDFFDKEAYRVSVQNKIQDLVKQISALRAQLQTQKAQVDALLSEQKSQQVQVSAAESEQSSMLSYNQGQQASYNAQTTANQKRLQQLIDAQRSANGLTANYYFLRFPGSVAPHNPAANDYPYANGGFGMSTAPGCVDNDGPDQWGYCTRQCVSYVAWEVQRSGRAAPRYYGNAKDWVAAARRDGVLVYTSDPQPGDVAISTAGTWGHAMYVEQVNGDQIYVSQYNQQLTGQYSTQWRSWE